MNRKKFLPRFFSIVVVILVLAAGYTFWPHTADLSAYQNLGQQYDVRILRDTWGVPHIFGKTDPDAAFGLAYANSEDDFLTIQQTLVAARGLLASVYGKDSAGNDFMVGLLRIWDQVNQNYETGLSPDSRALMEAYADGLNYYAARHPKEILTPEVFPATGKDIVAASIEKSPLFFGLDSTLGELFADTRQNDLSPTPSALRMDFDIYYGSNTLAVGPTRTSDGSTYLDVNSHQPWEGAVTWYEAHVHSDQGWDTTGSTFPGTPVIVHGHNRDLGWAFTVNQPDLTDVYVLTVNPNNKNQYRFDGQWLDFEVRQIPIKVKLYGNIRITVKQEALWTVYGPAVRRPHGTYAIRYAGYGRVDIFQQLYRMNKATNFKEWQDAMRNGGLPTFNVGYADKEGNIYYLYNAMIPIRQEGYDWSKYLPGDTSQTLWTEYLPFDKLPQVFNPPSGFIQNCNSTPFQTTSGSGNPDPKNFSPTMGIETFMTNRAMRALEQFSADESITFDEFKQYKFDVTYSKDSIMAKLVQKILSAPIPDDPDVKAALGFLRAWNFQDNATSTGATLAVYTYDDINDQFEKLKYPSQAWDNLSTETAMQSFTKTVHLLRDKFNRVDVPWSQVNRLIRGKTDLGLSGGPDVLHAVYGKLLPDGRRKGVQGDSFVQLVRWDPQGKVSAYSIHQYGSATLDQNSPHYADQSPLFVIPELKPSWYDEAEIRAHLEKEYRP